MGDRCTVHFNEWDEPTRTRIIERFGEPDDNGMGDQLTYWECNYGGQSEIEEILEEFPEALLIGTHSEGGEYSSCEFFTLDGELKSWETTIPDRKYVLSVEPSDSGGIRRADIDEQVHSLETFLAERAEALRRINANRAG